MSGSDVREAWLQRQDEDVARALANKSSGDALAALRARYSQLSADDRPIVDELLGDQLDSDDETSRFLAEALISEFKITSARSALRRLADRLENQHSAGAPYEWAKVSRLIASLPEATDLNT